MKSDNATGMHVDIGAVRVQGQLETQDTQGNSNGVCSPPSLSR